MARIFISYSRVDKTVTKVLVDRLRRMFGHDSVWFDDEIVGGDNWWDAILDQIAACDVFMYLLSNESVTSPYCQAEFEEAQRLYKQIITVQIRDKTRLTDELADIHYVDMTAGPDNTEALALLVGSINKQMEKVEQHRPKRKKRTPRPGNSKPEPKSEVDRTEVETPMLYPSTFTKKPGWGAWSPPVKAAIIGGIFTLFAAVIGILPALLDDTGLPTATPTTAIAVVETITLTPPPPTTFCLQGYCDDNPVTSNSQWEPVTDMFGGIEMVLVPAGCFQMGNDPDADTGAEDGGQQCFDEPFWIGRHEVTNAQFAVFLTVRGIRGPKGEYLDVDDEDTRIQRVEGNWRMVDEYAQHPVTEVTWFGAQDFCTWGGGQLPTEAQWEYAARGPDGLYFPWGNEFAWSKVVGNTSGTARVGTLPAGVSWIGALDLSGNVWEWTHSLRYEYPYNAFDGRESNQDTDSARVLRGGAWAFVVTSDFRAANRDDDVIFPHVSNHFSGFRCVRDYEP